MKAKSIIYSLTLTMIVGIFMSSCCQKSEKEADAVSGCTEIKCAAYPDDALMIVATLIVKDAAFQEDFEKALQAVVIGTNAEEGCIIYDAHQDINNPLVYVIYEVWESQDAINFHNETEHLKTFLNVIGGKVDANVSTMKKLY